MRELKFSKLYVAVYGGGYPNKKKFVAQKN